MQNLLSQKPFLYGLWAVLAIALFIIFWPKESKKTKLMREAQEYVAYGQYDEALEHVNQVLALGPNERVQEFRDQLVLTIDSVAFVDSLRTVDSMALASYRRDSLAFANAAPPKKEAYQAAFDGAEKSYGQKNWAKAKAAYARAYEILPSPIAKDKILECERREEGISLPDFKKIAGGTFQMNCEEVRVSDLRFSQAEVTNEQFCIFLNEMGNQIEGGVSWLELSKYAQIEMLDGKFIPKRGKAKHPVVEVSWYGAIAYCKWLGATYRLPTEAEWEYAAGWGKLEYRLDYAGTDGADLRYFANFKGKGGTDTFKGSAPVKTFKPNALGLYDMSGNVWEWCYPRFDGCDTKKEKPALIATLRAYRGGSWNSNTGYLKVDRSFNKYADERSSYIGFRPIQLW